MVLTIGIAQQRALCPIAAQTEVNWERLVGEVGAFEVSTKSQTLGIVNTNDWHSQGPQLQEHQ